MYGFTHDIVRPLPHCSNPPLPCRTPPQPLTSSPLFPHCTPPHLHHLQIQPYPLPKQPNLLLPQRQPPPKLFAAPENTVSDIHIIRHPMHAAGHPADIPSIGLGDGGRAEVLHLCFNVEEPGLEACEESAVAGCFVVEGGDLGLHLGVVGKEFGSALFEGVVVRRGIGWRILAAHGCGAAKSSSAKSGGVAFRCAGWTRWCCVVEVV
ncbi:hypothetical protein P154DRAFT_534324 [Amniculicola lignicola CBS 123094]|uniref:Uncharacterized protein n=1 Tax=Amniculicola lignicola CBS 123094 TaxID=1392246 RepID=A0A6A5WIN1_9PLEO|nr:hypothetical protein P154DRAFT_534324 [Amniculicola lignicola CBS 123094]